MGLTKDALRPRSDAGRGRRSGVREDAARPRACPVLDTGVIRRGIDSGGLRGERPAYDFIAGRRMREDAACPGRRTSVGELRDVKRPACFQRQTGACRSCGPAACQPCRRREEPVETTDALRPTGGGRGAESGPSMSPTARAIDSKPPDRCPATEAINSQPPDQCPASETINLNRRTGVQ